MIRLILGAIYLVCILFAIVRINPGLLNGSELPGISFENVFWPSVQFNLNNLDNGIASSVSGTNSSIYRNNPQRNPIYKLNGLPKNLKESWASQTINVGIHSASKSSPAVDESGVYVGSDTGWFYAFHLDGTLKWKFFFSSPTQGIHSTAALDNEFVYIGNYRGGLYCLDKSNGHLVWKSILGDTIGSSPLLLKNLLYVSVETASRNGFIVAVDRFTGALAWRSEPVGEQPHSSPTLSADERYLIVGVNDGSAKILDPKSGVVLSSAQIGGAIKSTFAFSEGSFFGTSWNQTIFRITPGKMELDWSQALSSKSQVSPVVFPGSRRVVTASVDGQISAFQIDSGKPTWTHHFANRPQISSPIGIKVKNIEYTFIYCRPKTFCLLNSKNGKIVDEWKVKYFFSSVPVIFDKHIYLSFDEGPLMSFSFQTY